MHRVKAVPAVLDIEADRIDGAMGSGESRRHRRLILQIRRHGLRHRLIRPKHRLDPLRMARGHPHREPTSEEMPHDPAAKEAGPTEHRDQSPTLRGARVDVFFHVIIIGHVSAPTKSDSLYRAEPFNQGLSSHPPAAQRLGQPLHHNGPCPIRFRPLAWPAEFREPTRLFGTRLNRRLAAHDLAMVPVASLNRLAEGQSARRDPVGGQGVKISRADEAEPPGVGPPAMT